MQSKAFQVQGWMQDNFEHLNLEPPRASARESQPLKRLVLVYVFKKASISCHGDALIALLITPCARRSANSAVVKPRPASTSSVC
jgi:hypothetical protein